MKEKDKSLLEIAIELLSGKQKCQKLNTIVREVMEIKGVKNAHIKELTPQFILDFMQSGYFVYCGDDYWDLKDRQPTSVLDKDGHDYDTNYDEKEEVESNQLSEENLYGQYNDSDYDADKEDDEDDDEDKEEENEYDLSKEFEYDSEEGFDNIKTIDELTESDAQFSSSESDQYVSFKEDKEDDEEEVVDLSSEFK